MDKKYEIIKIVGEGAYGIVYKCKNKETNKIVAIKKFKENKNKKAQMQMIREYKALQLLKHKNIIEFYEAFEKEGQLHLVIEYVQKNLLELLEQSPKGLEPKIINRLIYQMCDAIYYLHKNNIIHRDIKPENILIDENMNVKLCDFGFARKIKIDKNKNIQPMTDYVTTRWYRAPEVILSNGVYGPSIDYWAVGCIMGELADGNPLFPGESENDQLECFIKVLGNIPEKYVKFFNDNPNINKVKLLTVTEYETLDKKYKNILNQDAIDFMKHLLEIDQDKRITDDEVFKHKYLSSFINDNNNSNSNNNKNINSNNNNSNNNSNIDDINIDDNSKSISNSNTNSIDNKEKPNSINLKEEFIKNNEKPTSYNHKITSKIFSNLSNIKTCTDTDSNSNSNHNTNINNSNNNNEINYNLNVKTNINNNNKRLKLSQNINTNFDSNRKINKTIVPTIKLKCRSDMVDFSLLYHKSHKKLNKINLLDNAFNNKQNNIENNNKQNKKKINHRGSFSLQKSMKSSIEQQQTKEKLKNKFIYLPSLSSDKSLKIFRNSKNLKEQNSINLKESSQSISSIHNSNKKDDIISYAKEIGANTEIKTYKALKDISNKYKLNLNLHCYQLENKKKKNSFDVNNIIEEIDEYISPIKKKKNDSKENLVVNIKHTPNKEILNFKSNSLQKKPLILPQLYNIYRNNSIVNYNYNNQNTNRNKFKLNYYDRKKKNNLFSFYEF